MKTSDQEITELLKQMRISDRKADQVADEIRTGTRHLRRYEPDVPPEVLDRLERTIRTTLNKGRRHNPADWTRRIVAAAAAITIGFMAWTAFWLGPAPRQPVETRPLQTTQSSSVSYDERAMWDVALTQDEDELEKIDSFALTEVLMLWTESNEDTNNISIINQNTRLMQPPKV